MVTKENTDLRKKGVVSTQDDDVKSLKTKIFERRQNLTRTDILIKAQVEELSELRQYYRELCQKHGEKYNRELLNMGADDGGSWKKGDKQKEGNNFDISKIPDEYETGKVRHFFLKSIFKM